MDAFEQHILTSAFFEPYGQAASALTLAQVLNTPDIDRLRACLQAWCDRGLLKRLQTPLQQENPQFHPTKELWELRERLLHKLRRRHAALMSQQEQSLSDLILAIAVTYMIRKTRISGPFLVSNNNTRPRDEFHIYLFQFSADQIDRACDDLVTKGLLASRSTPAFIDVNMPPGVEPTPLGLITYRTAIRPQLRLTEEQTILDLVHKDAISIFLAWQSDYCSSRNQINTALENSVSQLNASKNTLYPVKIDLATDCGDGAVRIDSQLLDKIARADFLVADVTPVYKAFKRLTPNPNVLIEVGYALASKSPHQILLLSSDRPESTVPGDGPAHQLPFDLSTVHRIQFRQPRDLKDRLLQELSAALKKMSLWSPVASNLDEWNSS